MLLVVLYFCKMIMHDLSNCKHYTKTFDFCLNQRPHDYTAATFFVSHCLIDSVFYENNSVQSSLKFAWHGSR